VLLKPIQILVTESVELFWQKFGSVIVWVRTEFEC
jgi:hypothetical protein